MYRVELKYSKGLKTKSPCISFLMYRVELKSAGAGGLIVVPTEVLVPNVPCGVEMQNF